MRIEEIVQMTVTFGAKKKREAGAWNLERNKSLREAIEKCLATGEEVTLNAMNGVVFQVEPRFPLIESAMQMRENSHFKKVSVRVLVPAFSLGVYDEVTPAAPATPEHDATDAARRSKKS